MQYTNDLYTIGSYAVKNHMTPECDASQPGPDVIAIESGLGVARNPIETIDEFGQIDFPLGRSPDPGRVFADLPNIVGRRRR